MPFSKKLQLKSSWKRSRLLTMGFKSSFCPVKPVAVRRAFGSLEHNVQAIIL